MIGLVSTGSPLSRHDLHGWNKKLELNRVQLSWKGGNPGWPFIHTLIISHAMGDHGFALFILFLGAWRPRRSLGANVELHFQTFFCPKTHLYAFVHVIKNVLYMYN
jgi:hypothetical protein